MLVILCSNICVVKFFSPSVKPALFTSRFCATDILWMLKVLKGSTDKNGASIDHFGTRKQHWCNTGFII